MGVSNLWNVGAVEKNEYQLLCECEDPDDPMSLQFVKSNEPAPFPRCPWAVDLSDKPFPGRKAIKDGKRGRPTCRKLGGWFWETGFDRHPITDLERMRDQNLRAMYGAWDALKNVDGQYPEPASQVGRVHRRQARVAAPARRRRRHRPRTSTT